MYYLLQVFRKSRKVHPQEANPLDVKNMYYDEQMILEDEGNIHPLDGMLKKEIVTGEKAHWIKTDEECKFKFHFLTVAYKITHVFFFFIICIVDFVLEF